MGSPATPLYYPLYKADLGYLRGNLGAVYGWTQFARHGHRFPDVTPVLVHRVYVKTDNPSRMCFSILWLSLELRNAGVASLPVMACDAADRQLRPRERERDRERERETDTERETESKGFKGFRL